MRHVYEFDYADGNDDEPKPIRDQVKWPAKHLVAESFEDALAKAKQFLVDDNLRDEWTLKQGQDYQIVCIRRLMLIDYWPTEGDPK